MSRLWAFLVIAVFCPQAAPAQTVFEDFTGTWSWPDETGNACSFPTHSIAFSPDRRFAYFHWEAPIINYENEQDQDARYRVIAHDGASVTLALDGESRRTRDGMPVVWILRGMDDFSAYCWGRTDWPAAQCESIHLRCVAPPATS
ncbi:MAG: hypothetical protein ACRCSU_03590 [Paracoccaceae bacterium]